MKILTIVGARPQFVKAAVVSREFREQGIEEILVHTGQHYNENMSDIFFEEMRIPQPMYNLGISSLNHGAMTGRMLEKIEDLILKEKPDFVLVYGDTNSTLAGALAAKKLHIQVAHVEAGLRSFNMSMPEEVNRILTDQISDVFFVPSSEAIKNLELEGILRRNVEVIVSGDVMYDATMYYKTMATKAPFDPGYVLVTCHRAENTDDREKLYGIVRALNQINQQVRVIFPLHPRTQAKLRDYGLKLEVTVIEPVGYLDMIGLLNDTSLVITDSGGLQKEAYFFMKPCITLRDQTEWNELVQLGCNVLTGTDTEKIVSEFQKMNSSKLDFTKEIYGDGRAAKKIVDGLIKAFEKKTRK
jgi:UDP-GlcNAc3NAcA epimerase